MYETDAVEQVDLHVFDELHSRPFLQVRVHPRDVVLNLHRVGVVTRRVLVLVFRIAAVGGFVAIAVHGGFGLGVTIWLRMLIVNRIVEHVRMLPILCHNLGFSFYWLVLFSLSLFMKYMQQVE
jgi:hypothetical protein